MGHKSYHVIQINEIISGAGRAMPVKADVGKAIDVGILFEKTYQAFGKIDIVVNNAGIFRFNPIEAVSETDFAEHMNINVLSLFLTTQESLKYFAELGGSIINLSSGASVQPGQYSSLYGASKAAVDILTKSFAKELGSRKIRVNVIAPGLTSTEGVEKLGFFNDAQAIQGIENATALGRIGKPEDIASVVVFLASDASGWITGARVPVSRGLF